MALPFSDAIAPALLRSVMDGQPAPIRRTGAAQAESATVAHSANHPRNLLFVSSVRFGRPMWVLAQNDGFPPRPCEKTIAANHWAIYCRCARRGMAKTSDTLY
jgi:hypothetical protein